MDAIDIKSPAERYKEIADAIREKNGTTELVKPADMPQAILDIVSGGGSQYTSIVYNEDNTISLTDTDGVVHKMSYTYEDGKLIGVTYDNKAIELTYDGDVLVKVGSTVIDLDKVPTGSSTLDHTVTFMAGNELYEVISVRDGNSISEPITPRVEKYFFNWWETTNEERISFPYTPSDDVLLLAKLTDRFNVDVLYEFFGVDITVYPYVVVGVSNRPDARLETNIDFLDTPLSDNGTNVLYKGGIRYESSSSVAADINDSQDTIVDAVKVAFADTPLRSGYLPDYRGMGAEKYFTNCVRDYPDTINIEYLTEKGGD